MSEEYTEDINEDIYLEDDSLPPQEDKTDILHNAVYDISLCLKKYVEENYLPLLDRLNYEELFFYIEHIQQVKKT